MFSSTTTFWHDGVQRLREDRGLLWRLLLATLSTYLLIDVLFPGKADMTGTLTALLVVQASVYTTIYTVAERIIAVLTGVALAVGLGHFFGMNIFSLGVAIGAGLLLGTFLGFKDNKLEIPISAMLILAATSQGVASQQRVINTLIGAGVGIIIILLLPQRPKLSQAIQAVNTMAGTTAEAAEKVATRMEESTSNLTGPLPTLNPVLMDLIPHAMEAKATVREVRKAYLLNPAVGQEARNHKVDLLEAITALEKCGPLLQKILMGLEAQSQLPSGARISREVRADFRLIYSQAVQHSAELIRAFGELLGAGAEEYEKAQERVRQARQHLLGSQGMLMELVTAPGIPESSAALIMGTLRSIDELLHLLQVEELGEYQVSTTALVREKLPSMTVLTRENLKQAPPVRAVAPHVQATVRAGASWGRKARQHFQVARHHLQTRAHKPVAFWEEQENARSSRKEESTVGSTMRFESPEAEVPTTEHSR